MADSVALQILQAIQTRLDSASVVVGGVTHTPPAALKVERERLGPINPATVKSGPIIVLHMGGQLPTERDHHKSPMLVRTMEVLTTIAANANDVLNSEALDPATNWLVLALQSEPTLGGVAHWISEEGQEDYYTQWEESADVIAIRELKLSVRFHTRTDNPTTRS